MVYFKELLGMFKVILKYDVLLKLILSRYCVNIVNVLVFEV